MSAPTAAPKSRRLMQIGSICLIAGLLPRIFDVTFGLRRDSLHFLCGFLLALAAVTLLGAIRMTARQHCS